MEESKEIEGIQSRKCDMMLYCFCCCDSDSNVWTLRVGFTFQANCLLNFKDLKYSVILWSWKALVQRPCIIWKAHRAAM